MKVDKVDEPGKRVSLELTQEDLDTPMSTKEGLAIVEVEMADSDGWCSEGHIKTGQRVSHLVQTYPDTTEIVVRAGKPWILRQLIPLKDVLFPDGMPLDPETEKKIEESQNAAS